MKKYRIYVDTSVIGGCCDKEFEKWSCILLDEIKLGMHLLLLSELTQAEIFQAPVEVKKYYRSFADCADQIIEISKEAIELADEYLRHNILSSNFRDDARHIALATIADADVLVSWNYKHIVHFEKIQKFNAVNIEMGYKPIAIYSPKEVVKYEY